jgi:hypothetical protein
MTIKCARKVGQIAAQSAGWIFGFLILLAFSRSAVADPQFRWGFQGSYFYIFASNAETKQYSCNYSYSFTYTDYGETKSRSLSGSFAVYAGAKDLQVLVTTGSYVSPQLQGGPNIQCT